MRKVRESSDFNREFKRKISIGKLRESRDFNRKVKGK